MVVNEPILFDATRTVVIKTNNKCNLKCSYCYEELNQIKQKPSMTIESVEKIYDSLLSYCKRKSIQNLNIIWHGGEPMLMELDFYKEIIDLQKKIDLQFSNLMQTNGTRISDKWIDFFIENNFKIGVSFDGSPTANSIHRQNTTAVLRNIRLLNQRGISPSIICVISDSNYIYQKELFDFLSTVDIEYLDLVPCYENNGKYSLSIEHYVDFFIKVFDRWWKDSCQINIRLFSNIVAIMKGKVIPGQYVTCSLTGRCGEIISIEPSGDVYFCDCLPKERNSVIGNIMHQDVYSLKASDAYQVLYNINKSVHIDCLKCTFRLLCGGGCLTRRLNTSHFKHGKDYYCEARKKLFSHIQDAIGRVDYNLNIETIPAFTRGPQPKYDTNGTAKDL